MQDLLEEAINNVDVTNLVNGMERINSIKLWMKNSEKWKEQQSERTRRKRKMSNWYISEQKEC